MFRKAYKIYIHENELIYSSAAFLNCKNIKPVIHSIDLKMGFNFKYLNTQYYELKTVKSEK